MLTVAFGLVAVAPLAEAVGFQQLSIPDAADRPLLVGIWYPSETPVLLRPLELYSQEVAPDGTISGDRLPLIVMSHGTGESLSAHYDTGLRWQGPASSWPPWPTPATTTRIAATPLPSGISSGEGVIFTV